MILTTEQKKLFVSWLETQILSAEAIKNQMNNTGLPELIKDQLVKRELMTILSCKYVKQMLLSGEEQVIEKG